MAKKYTCTTMIYTDGKESTFAVYVGPMRGKSFNLNRAERIATYTVTAGTFDYKEVTGRHATAEAPAVYWQA